jgi:tetratricopeptide (TPR) repeat protein
MRKYICIIVLALIVTIGFATKAVATSKRYYYNHGFRYMKLGKYKLAIKDFNQAISIDPKYAKAYFLRGISYKKVGQYQRAELLRIIIR